MYIWRETDTDRKDRERNRYMHRHTHTHTHTHSLTHIYPCTCDPRRAVCTAMQALTDLWPGCAVRFDRCQREREREREREAHMRRGSGANSSMRIMMCRVSMGGNTRSMALHRQTVKCFGGRRRGLVKAVHYIATGPRRATNHYLPRSLGWR